MGAVWLILAKTVFEEAKRLKHTYEHKEMSE